MRTSVKMLIHRHIYGLKEGTPFTTRDVVGCGNRNSVDQALCRLIKDGLIRRLARGIFVRDPHMRRKFEFWEIAKIKAQSFHRKIFRHPSSILEDFCPDRKADQKTIFSINARSSKFKVGDQSIFLKETCERKAALTEMKLGDHIRALWLVGERNWTSDLLPNAMRWLGGGRSLGWLRKNAGMMPAWLTNKLVRFEQFRYARIPLVPPTHPGPVRHPLYA